MAEEQPDPIGDPARLDALASFGVLDTPAEAEFDRLTHLAARLLNAPVGLVSLVTAGRQFFKSCIGLPEPWATRRETPLSHSFCQYGIRSTGPHIVEDAREDPLLRDNPAISELGVVAYLGIPLVTDRGHVLGFFCVIDTEPRTWTPSEVRTLTDLAASVMTELRLHRELRERGRLVERLREAERRKDEFLAMLAHELRNPLAAIRSAVRLAGSPGMAEHLPEALEVIERQSRNLSRLVDDLLDVARITQGKVELKREVVDVTSVLSRAAQAVRPLIERKHQELTIRVAAAGLLRVDADPTRLEQIVVNLLTNAAKYTESGGRITASAGREGGEAVIRVSDTGVGISPEMLAQVFDLFTQVDLSLARCEGGLGIGLTLVKRLVELHGGSIAAASEPGRGSEFTVRLPAHEAVAEATRPEGRPQVSGRGERVLLVDDNADMAWLTAWSLRSMGFEVQVAREGREAIESAREHRPEVVLLDIGLPGMDGYEVARRLRREEGCTDSLIIAVSGYGDESSRERGREAGFDYHLTKPVDIEAVVDLVSRGEGSGPSETS